MLTSDSAARSDDDSDEDGAHPRSGAILVHEGLADGRALCGQPALRWTGRLRAVALRVPHVHPNGQVRATDRRRAMNTRGWLHGIARLMGDTAAVRRGRVGRRIVRRMARDLDVLRRLAG